ncbi:MAG: DUF6179 domain-containing protein [Lachnospiraceae bacterium]
MKEYSNLEGLYEMEELLPLVAKLAASYTACDSSSVTYERARGFMEAVLYCIRHFYDYPGNCCRSAERISAIRAYELGYKIVNEQVKKALYTYNQLMEYFCSYGNETYRDTVEKGIPCFFLYYDVKYAPTENIITMDYPIIEINTALEGIDRISAYINCIAREQKFLQSLPVEYVISSLRSFHPRYEKEIINLKEIIEKFG